MNLSDTGLGTLRPGEHLCFPYDHEDENLSTSVAFVREGLARHERCFFVGTPDERSGIVLALEAAGIATKPALDRGALVLASHEETYLRTGRFEAEDTLALVDDLIEGALTDGFAGLRATGGTAAPIPDDLWPELLIYEARINELVARRPFVGLCRYHAAHVSAERFQDMLRTHPRAVVRGDVCENPFYEPADLALRGDSRARADWQLHQLRAHHRLRKRLVRDLSAAFRKD